MFVPDVLKVHHLLTSSPTPCLTSTAQPFVPPEWLQPNAMSRRITLGLHNLDCAGAQVLKVDKTMNIFHRPLLASFVGCLGCLELAPCGKTYTDLTHIIDGGEEVLADSWWGNLAGCKFHSTLWSGILAFGVICGIDNVLRVNLPNYVPSVRLLGQDERVVPIEFKLVTGHRGANDVNKRSNILVSRRGNEYRKM